MKNRPSIWWILCGASLSLLLPVIGSLISALFFSDRRWEHLPLHSMIESAGGLMAIAIAGILLVERPRQADSDYFVWMATALLGMGTLDLFHAAVLPGLHFVWLHSTATFFGGLVFACVWLPSTWLQSRWVSRLPWMMLVATVIFGGVSCLSPYLPAMLSGVNRFTALARGLNISGGIGFFLAGVFFIRRFHRHARETDWLFAMHTVLFGAAGVLFEMSALWDADWWWWHILRLMAYGAAFVFAIGAYLDFEHEVHAANESLTRMNEQLDRTVLERTTELRISEERYSLAVRGSTDGLWDWNLLTNQVYYSPRFKELLGYEDQEFQNVFDSFQSHLHPDDVGPTLNAVQQHLQDRTAYDVEYRLRVKTGAYRWFRARGQAIWNEHGRPHRMAGSITDIADRKSAERRLNYERFLLETLFEHLPDAIFFKDLEGRFTRVTRSLSEWLGAASTTDVIGKTVDDFLPADFAQEARRDEQQMIETGQPLFSKEFCVQWPDGRERWISTTKVPLRDESGKVVGTFGISHDISAQKQAQERFRLVVEAAPNAILVVSASGQIKLINAATERQFGYRREELLDQPVEILVPQPLRRAHEQWRLDFMQHLSPRSMGPGRELKGLHKDGSELSIEVGLNPIQFDNELVILASVYDVTQRRAAEKALTDAKEAAEAANRAKSDFLANMSHEIRTPMNAIIGMTELILETDTNRTQADYLRIVLESAESLLSIINQILDFSKIEAGRLELEHRDFDLREEVGDTLKVLGHRAHAKELELAWHIDDQVPRYLRGDATRLRQILVNLVGNAIKFTPRGEIVVEIQRQPSDDSRVVLHATVSDTGVGIPPDKQDRVFRAFEQADMSTTREFGGTGLGLVIAARIVEAMDGKIWLESRVNQGSQFHFTIACKLGDPTDASHLAQLPRLQDLEALIIDDNATNRRILGETLEDWGLTVTLAESAADALALLESRSAAGAPLPILISDVNMPQMDGFMLAETLRHDARFRTLPVILLTSGGRRGDARRCEGLGIIAHLIKPAKHSELMEAIARAAGKWDREDASTETATDLLAIPPLKILLVEDGKANQMLAKKLLEKWSHVVFIVENGLEAVNCLETETFDLVLMDVQMPVMDGLEATRRIRAKEAGQQPHVPIVAMTAHAMKGDRDRCLEVGMDAYIAKPFRRQELEAILQQLFRPAPGSTPEHDTAIVSQSLPCIDWTAAAANADGDAAMMAQWAETTSQELTEELKQLQVAAADRDLTTLHEIAGAMKGMLHTMAAFLPAELAGQVEAAAETGEQPRLDALLDRLVPLIRQTVAELRALRR